MDYFLDKTNGVIYEYVPAIHKKSDFFDRHDYIHFTNVVKAMEAQDRWRKSNMLKRMDDR